jgi:hypothetical protein
MVRRERHNVMRQISMTTRKELIEALRVRYRGATYGDRVKILDEFAALTGYHRKHAIRLLGGDGIAGKATPKCNRLYDEADPAHALLALPHKPFHSRTPFNF